MSFKDRVKDFKTPRRVPVDIDGFPDGLFLEERPYYETQVLAAESDDKKPFEQSLKLLSISITDDDGEPVIRDEEDMKSLRNLPYKVVTELVLLMNQVYGFDEESMDRIKKKFNSDRKNGSGSSSLGKDSTAQSTKPSNE